VAAKWSSYNKLVASGGILSNELATSGGYYLTNWRQAVDIIQRTGDKRWILSNELATSSGYLTNWLQAADII